MNTARLYLIRHPKTALDPAIPSSAWRLSEEGHAQVKGIAVLPFWATAAAVYTSSQSKTTIVGDTIHAAWQIPHHVEAGLDEACRDRWLDAEGFAVAQQAFFADLDAPPAKAWETASAAQNRFAAAMDRILAQHPASDSLAVVTHASVLALYVAALWHQTPSYTAWQQIGFAAIMVVDRATMQPITPFVSPPYSGL